MSEEKLDMENNNNQEEEKKKKKGFLPWLRFGKKADKIGFNRTAPKRKGLGWLFRWGSKSSKPIGGLGRGAGTLGRQAASGLGRGAGGLSKAGLGGLGKAASSGFGGQSGLGWFVNGIRSFVSGGKAFIAGIVKTAFTTTAGTIMAGLTIAGLSIGTGLLINSMKDVKPNSFLSPGLSSLAQSGKKDLAKLPKKNSLDWLAARNSKNSEVSTENFTAADRMNFENTSVDTGERAVDETEKKYKKAELKSETFSSTELALKLGSSSGGGVSSGGSTKGEEFDYAEDEVMGQMEAPEMRGGRLAVMGQRDARSASAYKRAFSSFGKGAFGMAKSVAGNVKYAAGQTEIDRKKSDADLAWELEKDTEEGTGIVPEAETVSASGGGGGAGYGGGLPDIGGLGGGAGAGGEFSDEYDDEVTVSSNPYETPWYNGEFDIGNVPDNFEDMPGIDAEPEDLGNDTPWKKIESRALFLVLSAVGLIGVIGVLSKLPGPFVKPVMSALLLGIFAIVTSLINCASQMFSYGQNLSGGIITGATATIVTAATMCMAGVSATAPAIVAMTAAAAAAAFINMIK